ncbi:hypothetical protein F7725_011035 [Dissostichus mawsoni]|uniref:Uncharacterized protein n=1 Tax=Dissostichus mawsoni TaxID=36200 RepID=A0A7J5Z7P4_DISMA|nr:hypothetical protein F7725_011035 [Dissostichus mawsoni]
MEGSSAPGAKANGPIAAPSSPTSSKIGPPLSPEDLDDGPQSSLTDVTQMWITFVKTFAIIFPIYVLGYFEFSFSWVLIGLAMLFYWRKNHGTKDYRINRALAYLDYEDKVLKQSVPTSDLPPWVHYPDVERVEWLNKTVKQMWPFISQFVDKLFRETIEPAVKAANPHLSSFCFTKIDMGDKPLRVNGVKVYTENVDKRQVIMDLQISFVGNTEIDVDIKKYYCRAGIKSIQLHGTLRVLLDINWSGLTNMLDIPGVSGLCDNIIQDVIYSFLVLPNRITIPLVGEAQLAQLRFPIPQSDPYGVIKVGTQLFQSKVIHETVNPKWNEVYEALMYEHAGPNMLEIELFDEDTDKDDFLGVVCDRRRGDREDSPQTGVALTSIKADRNHANDGLSSALLVVSWIQQEICRVFEGNLGSGYLKERRAAGLVFCENTASLYRTLFHSLLTLFLPLLQSGKKVTSDPNPFVQFRVGHKSYDSKTRYKTNEPVWEEAFTFLIHNPAARSWKLRLKTRNTSVNKNKKTNPQPAASSSDSPVPPSSTFDIPRSASVSTQDVLNRRKEANDPYRSVGSTDLGQGGRGGGGLAQSGRSSSNLAISGHSSQRNKLIVVVHGCRYEQQRTRSCTDSIYQERVF